MFRSRTTFLRKLSALPPCSFHDSSCLQPLLFPICRPSVPLTCLSGILSLLGLLSVGSVSRLTSYNLHFWSCYRHTTTHQPLLPTLVIRRAIDLERLLWRGERGDREETKIGTYVVAVGPSILNCGFLTTNVQTSSHDLYIDRWP